MSDKSTDAAPDRARMARCADGHIFDAAKHEACPTCGSASAQGADADLEQGGGASGSPRRKFPLAAMLAVSAAAVAALAALVFLRGAPWETGAPSSVAASVEKFAPADIESAPAAERRSQRASNDVPPSAALTPQEHRPQIERWRTVMALGGRSYVCVNETTTDGRYRLGDGCPPAFAGETGTTIVNADGSWTSRSDTGRTDSGTIQVLDADRFIAHTRGGPILWERVSSE